MSSTAEERQGVSLTFDPCVKNMDTKLFLSIDNGVKISGEDELLFLSGLLPANIQYTKSNGAKL